MAFGGVIAPGTTADHANGLLLLLDLIANPEKAKDAKDLLEALSKKSNDAQQKLDAAKLKHEEALEAEARVAAAQKAFDQKSAEHKSRLEQMQAWIAQQRG